MTRNLPAALLASLLTAGSAWAGECREVARDLEVATLNAWGLPFPIARQRRSRFPRITRFLEEQGFDVVGLQEVWRGSLGLLDIQGLVLPHGYDGDSGLAIVTPHSVASSRMRTFRAERGFDRLKDKGLLMSVVDMPEYGPVDVWVTHLQAGVGRHNAQVRASQIDEILDQARGIDHTVLLMGDFNLYEHNPVDQQSRRRLVDAGLIDAADEVGDTRSTHTGAAQRFDRVFVRGQADHCVATRALTVFGYDDDPDTPDPPFLSDHLPVRATFGFAPPL